jgi:hypothetical protein
MRARCVVLEREVLLGRARVAAMIEKHPFVRADPLKGLSSAFLHEDHLDCTLCKKILEEFSEINVLQRQLTHFRKKIDERPDSDAPRLLRCRFCNYGFRSRIGRATHMKRIHPRAVAGDAPDADGVFTHRGRVCPLCKYNLACASESTYEVHLRKCRAKLQEETEFGNEVKP